MTKPIFQKSRKLCGFPLVAAFLTGPQLLQAEDATSDLPTPPVYDWGDSATDPPPGFDFPKLSPQLPYDLDSLKNSQSKSVTGKPGNIIAQVQKQFDLFSWATFVALNWPADNHGNPLKSVPIGTCSDTTRVWEHYFSPSQFFKDPVTKDGKMVVPPPDAWGTPEHVSRKLGAISKRTHILDEVDEAFFNLAIPMPSITDLNNEYVRYEVRFNQPEYDYMKPFYSVEKQKAYVESGKSFEFPMGRAAKPGGEPGQMGAMELKVAWKKMGKGDDLSKFYTIDATVVDPLDTDPKTSGRHIYGMVGMHIMVRTESAPQWLWATFEHVDNAPQVTLPLSDGQTEVVPEKVDGKAKTYSFWDENGEGSVGGFDEDLYVALVALGNERAKAGRPGDFHQKKDDRKPSQIAQVVTTNNEVLKADWTNALNRTMQKKLAGTVWANYRLISTQWPTDPEQKPTPARSVSLGAPAPVSLGNPVMETYLQVNGSCMGCHAGATLGFQSDQKDNYYTNFSFLLQRAKSAKTSPVK